MKKSYPEHWVETTLDNICTIETGKWNANHAASDGKYRFYTCASEYQSCHTNSFSGECIILPGNGANVGEVFYYFGEFDAYQRTYVLSNFKIHAKYSFYHLLLNWKKINQDKQYGSATNYIRIGNFKNYIIPLPPLNEQKRIVAKLDAILPKVKSARDRLENIPAILKKFRQSVLAAACSGKLTEDWREGKNFNLHEYLEVIINERKKNKKYSKYLNTIIELNLPIEWSIENDVPESWLITKMGIICPKITDGTHDTPKRLKKGIPYITGKHIRDRYIDFNNCDYITIEEHKKIYARCNPEYDDVLMVNIGAGTATPARVNVTYEFSMKNVALLKVDNKLITGRYLEYHQLRFKDYIFNQITKGGAQPFLSLDIIKALPLYLPPLEEQHEIVHRVEKLFALADSIEEKYKKAHERLEKLEQAILARAFRGELVKPDPNDEPAEELLKRILEEKAKLGNEKKAKKKGRGK